MPFLLAHGVLVGRVLGTHVLVSDGAAAAAATSTRTEQGRTDRVLFRLDYSFLLEPLSGLCFWRTGIFARQEGLAMKSKELKQALCLIKRVSADSSMGTVQRDQLLLATRELEAIARSGKLERERLFLAVELVATVLNDIVDPDAAR